MIPLLYGISSVLVLWGILELGDRFNRARMLSRLRCGTCPKCNAVIGASDLRVSGRIVETFGERPGPLPYGAETFVDLRCESCTRTSTLNLRGDDVSVMFEDGHIAPVDGLHA